MEEGGCCLQPGSEAGEERLQDWVCQDRVGLLAFRRAIVQAKTNQCLSADNLNKSINSDKIILNVLRVFICFSM